MSDMTQPTMPKTGQPSNKRKHGGGGEPLAQLPLTSELARKRAAVEFLFKNARIDDPFDDTRAVNTLRFHTPSGATVVCESYVRNRFMRSVGVTMKIEEIDIVRSSLGKHAARILGEAAAKFGFVYRCCRCCMQPKFACECEPAGGDTEVSYGTAKALGVFDLTTPTLEGMDSAEIERVYGLIEAARQLRLCGCKEWLILDPTVETCFECAMRAASQPPTTSEQGRCPVCLEAQPHQMSRCCRQGMHAACVAGLAKCPLCQSTAPFV